MKKIYNEISENFRDYLKKNNINTNPISINEDINLETLIKKINDKKNIVVLGLNPSSNEINDEIKDDGILHYLPADYLKDAHIPIYNSLKKKNRKLFYEQYFKKPHELFYEYKYLPYWTNPIIGVDILNKIFSENRINKSEFEILKSYLDENNEYNFLYFADMLPVRITKSYYVKDFLNQLDLKIKTNFIHERINHILNIYNPKIILINNAFVSDLLFQTKFENEVNHKTYKSINENKTFLVFSSIMSNGNLDKYSEYRLKNEIRTLLT